MTSAVDAGAEREASWAPWALGSASPQAHVGLRLGSAGSGVHGQALWLPSPSPAGTGSWVLAVLASPLLPKWGHPQEKKAGLQLAGRLAWHVAGTLPVTGGNCTAPGEVPARLYSEDVCLSWFHPGWWPLCTVELQGGGDRHKP